MLKLFGRTFIFRLLLIIVVISGILYVNREKVEEGINRLLNKSQSQELPLKEAETTPEAVENAPTLRAKKESPQSSLSVKGVIQFTNSARSQNGLSALTENSLLNLSALRKAQDMFDKQYFEHNSPAGIGVDDLAKEVGYSYILIGENLAVGNFLNDSELVQGWMDSPGHRANILNTRYSQIGVAVLKGTFEGRSTWMAVQHFGLPLSACPSPDSSLKRTIDANNARLNQLSAELAAMKAEIEATPQTDSAYNQKVDAYNAKVSEFNSLNEQTKALVAKYNSQVDAFNACASG